MSRSLYARLTRRYRPEARRLDRREFLQLTLAASGGLLAGCATTTHKTPAVAANGRKIILVGAGLGGLACAWELARIGYDVTVLESRARLGGRVLSFRDFVAGKNVEGGGELIGANHPTWLAYERQFDLKLMHVSEDDSLEEPILLEGKRLTEREARSLHAEMEAAYGTMIEDARRIDADAPWRSPDAESLDQKSTADWLDQLKVSRLCQAAVRVETSANNAVPLARQSYLGNLALVKGGGLEKFWTESEVYRCRGGNQQLATRLAGAIGADRIRLSTPVVRIEVATGGARVTCGDGLVIEADDLVLTAPPSVWRRIRFEPELPAVLAPQMGTAVKYLAAVTERFWRKNKQSPSGMSDGAVSMTWDGTDGQYGGKESCLVAFSGGPAAELCRQRWEDSHDQAYRTELENLYPEFGRSFNDSRFMDWPGETWTAAGYSFPAPGEVTTVGPRLREGMGRLHFAGEYACYQFAGYMEGALNSGVALAKRLAARDGVTTTTK